MFPLKISKRAEQLAITNIAAIGEQGLQGSHEQNPLLRLQRPGGIDDSELLLIVDGRRNQS